MVDLKSEEILTYLCLIVVGYFLAKMFSLRCDGFSVGGNQTCEDMPQGGCFGTCTWVDRSPPLNGFCKENGFNCIPRPRWQTTPKGKQCYNIPKSECLSNDYCEEYYE